MLVTKWLCENLLKVLGWTVDKTNPPVSNCVVIAAPHTSNMDFFLALPTLWAWDIKGHYLIKKEHFWWPFSWFLKKTGGIPVDQGFRDYFKYVNATGGVNGVMLDWETCEFAYNTGRGVECYDRIKSKNGNVIRVNNVVNSSLF